MAIEEIKSHAGTHSALLDLLEGMLDEAREALETETEIVKLYHAQGRVAAIRELMIDFAN